VEAQTQVAICGSLELMPAGVMLAHRPAGIQTLKLRGIGRRRGMRVPTGTPFGTATALWSHSMSSANAPMSVVFAGNSDLEILVFSCPTLNPDLNPSKRLPYGSLYFSL